MANSTAGLSLLSQLLPSHEFFYWVRENDRFASKVGSDGARFEQVVHQGRIELGLHVQQAGLFVGVTAGPVVVSFSYDTVQKTQNISLQRNGGDHWVVFHWR